MEVIIKIVKYDVKNSITLDKDGAVDILFTAGENLQIEHGGELLRPRGSGTAKISIK